jgi:spore coat protein A
VPLFLFDRVLDEDGQLQYPTSGMPDAPWVSEVYGDAILVNGKLTPDFEVERAAYRFRICNAFNARFFYLSLSNGSPLVQLGSDQGFLQQPLPQETIALAPGERADVLIDFAALGGQTLYLMSQAFQLMRIRVQPGAALPKWAAPGRLREVPRIAEASATNTRRLPLEEFQDPSTRGMLMLLNRKRWHEPVTERPLLHSTEIWELVNLTEDTHPIHLHLVRFQVLDRQLVDLEAWRFRDSLRTVGDRVAPEPNELGWKDTVQAHSGSITRIIVNFEGYAGRYVWHCHVLEHAANEMMRPFEVIRPAS